MNKTVIIRCRLRFISFVFLVALGFCTIPSNDVCAQDASGLSLKLYSGDPDNAQNEYTLESDPRDPDEKYSIKLILVLKNIAQQPIFTEREFSQTELHRTLRVTDPCGQPMELDPEASPFTLDAGKPRFVAGRALIPAETLEMDFVRSLTVEDLRNLFPEMYILPGEYTVAAQLKGARFFVTEIDEVRGLLGVANHRSNWFGIIEAKVGDEQKPTMTILILPVTGGRLKIKVEEQGVQATQPLFGVPVKAFVGSITQDLQTVWEATDMEPVLTGISETNGDVKWDCNKCLAAGVYTILAKHQEDYQAVEITEANSGWSDKCSGQISQKITFLKESQPIVITGGAYNFPQDDVYDASFSMDVNSDGITHSGWLKYYYTKTRLNFVSTAITGVDVTANEATIQGTGTVNGQAGFTFEANVVDGTPDQFGLLIRNSQGDTIYSAPLMETAGGDLIIIVQRLLTGGAYNFPQGDAYDASFSMEISSNNINFSGWLKYYYTRTRMSFISTALTEANVSENSANIKGTGTVNGQAGFTFEANVVDGTPDQFGLLIKDSQGDTVYSAPLIETAGGDLQIFVQTAHTQG